MKLHAPGGGAVFIGPHMLLPADKARHVGEAVAMVVAETQAQALDVAEASRSTTRSCRSSCIRKTRMKPGAPRVWDETPDNMPVDTFFGDPAATDAAFASRAHVVAKNFHIGRVTGVPTRAALRARRIRCRDRALHAACGQRRRRAAEE